MKLLPVFILLSVFCKAQNFDIDLLRKINTHRNTQLDKPFIVVTKSCLPIALVTPSALFSYSLACKNDSLKNKSLEIGAAIAVSAVFSTALKYSINRKRPFQKYNDIEQVIPVLTASFPSGHTSTAFSTATSLSLVFPKWYVIAPAFTWAGAVAYSRMHLGEHYPSDVAAGAIIGAGSAWLCHWLNKKIIYKNKK